MSPTTTILDDTCIHIHGLLSADDQCALLDYINERDCTNYGAPPPMVPSPKTLMFGLGRPMLPLTSSDPSPATEMVDRTQQYVLRGGHDGSVPIHCSNLLSSAVGEAEVSMAVIRYEAPDGKFPLHCDHCNDGSLVYLMTLGCAAHFFVKTPSMERGKAFDLESGDMLVFDASTAANVLHAVKGIKEGSCPSHLAERSEVMRAHRYGVQCRVRGIQKS